MAVFESRFLKESGLLLGAYKHIREDEKQTLIIDMISDEALKTSKIEGEFLNCGRIQSSIRRRFGLQQDLYPAELAEQNIAEMMVDLYRTYSEPLSHKMLNSWHEMLMRNNHNIITIGNYRTHEEPMQVVSGYAHKPIVHYEAPPSSQMRTEMEAFIDWFNDSSTLPTLIRAGLVHLYFVSIHPYKDVNGRIVRALVEKALAQKPLEQLGSLRRRILHGFYKAVRVATLIVDKQTGKATLSVSIKGHLAGILSMALNANKPLDESDLRVESVVGCGGRQHLLQTTQNSGLKAMCKPFTLRHTNTTVPSPLLKRQGFD